MQVKTRIRIMKPGDARTVAQIHHSEIGGFLPSLGISFLEQFYGSAIKTNGVFVFVSEEKDRITGFVSCCESSGGLWSRVMKKDPTGFILSLVKAITANPRLIFTLARTLFYPGFAKDSPELLSIAVRKENARKGTGTKLFRRTISEFKKRKKDSFLISIYKGNGAEQFYLKMGCRLFGSFPFLGKTMNYYRYE